MLRSHSLRSLCRSPRSAIVAWVLCATALGGCLGTEIAERFRRTLLFPFEAITNDSPWSPDGRRLLVALLDDPFPLRIVHLDGSPPERIPGKFLTPSWSPDGTRILVAAPWPPAETDGAGDLVTPVVTPAAFDGIDLVVMSADGSDARCLATAFGATWLSPAWSPDGEWIAYSTDGIELVRPDGSERRSLGPGFVPVWSPDSTRIASVLFEEAGEPPRSWIQIQRADGSGTTRLAVGLGPSWSPDGTRLVFWDTSRNEEGRMAVAVVDADGGNLHAVCDGLLPSWSPNGERILAHELDGGLFTIAPDGSDRCALAEDAFLARWSPDGRWIAFRTETDLRVIRADGSGERSLGPLAGR